MISFAILPFYFISSTEARAYFDPGTSSYVIQVIIALFASVIFYIKHPMLFIKEIMNNYKRKKTSRKKK
jgi:hypothetical protein